GRAPLFRVTRGGASFRLGGFFFAVLRRGVRLERIDELARDGEDALDGFVEHVRVLAARFAGAAHFADELQRRRAALVVGRRRLEVEQRADVPAHGERAYLRRKRGPLSRNEGARTWLRGRARAVRCAPRPQSPRARCGAGRRGRGRAPDR